MKHSWWLLGLIVGCNGAFAADLVAVYQRALQNDPQLREAAAHRLAALESKPQALSALLNCHIGLSSDMALRLEKAFGVRIDTLLRMQTVYDIAQTR